MAGSTSVFQYFISIFVGVGNAILGKMLKDVRIVFIKFLGSTKEIDMTTSITAPMPSGNAAIRRRGPLTSLRSDLEGFFNNIFEDGHGGLLSQSGMNCSNTTAPTSSNAERANWASTVLAP
jgi:hypothetical protein